MQLPEGKKIVLFDGVCNLCDQSVQFIIKYDKKDCFRFVSLQSSLGEKILNKIAVDRTQTDSIILYEPRIAYYVKANAALRILKELYPWTFMYYLFIVFPDFIKNNVYDFIARNRYRWYGKKESCLIPNAALKAKFLE